MTNYANRLWVIDTNVLVAGLLTSDSEAPPARIVDALFATHIRHLVSVELLAEYREVLLRPKLRKLHGLDAADVDELLEGIATDAVVADLQRRAETAPDPGDDHLWQLLAASPGAGLITGDELLIRQAPAGVAVIRPREWFET